MKIYIGADHRGFKLKEELIAWLEGLDVEVDDVGAEKLDVDDDYVEYARKVSENVSDQQDDNNKDVRGIIICGSGVGVDIVANRTKGVRCGLGISSEQVKAARNDDDINVLALAADYTKLEEVKRMVTMFIETDFSHKEKHQRRIDKIS